MRLSLAGLILIFASVGTYLLISSRAASTLTADFNSDGVVNVTDLSVLATNWGRTTATHAQGDANSDGTINIYDLSILASQWGQTNTTPAPDPNWQTSLANAQAGDVIVIPEGTYTLTQGQVQWPGGDLYCNLVIPSGVTLKGSGVGKTILVGGGTTSTNVIGSVSTTNIAISDMTIMVDISRKGSTSQDGIKMENVDGATVSNVELKYLYIASNIIGSRNVTYTNVHAIESQLGIDAINIATYTNTANVLIKDSTATGITNGWGFGTYDDTSQGSDVHVSGVTFQNDTATGNDTTGLFCHLSDGLTIIGGDYSNNTSEGVKLNTCLNYLVSGANATNNPSGNFVYIASTSR
ncbi:MAG TPA: dockerin type I domain-containing protein [Patescibacteria group bacterium]|nr:dockerin type I domain-containing protein [Patescibacteria group bacterium]